MDPDAEFDVVWWSRAHNLAVPIGKDPGALIPALTVARDITEAAAIVNRRPDDSMTVIVSVDQVSSAAASLEQLRDVQVVALVPQCAIDTEADLRRSGYKFFDWTPELETCIAHRPQSSTVTAIDRYETAVRKQLHSTVSVHDVELDSVETTLASLKEFSRRIRDDYADDIPGSLAAWAERSQRLFFDLDGSPVRLEGARVPACAGALDELKQDLSSTGRMWSARASDGARTHLAELERLLADLQRCNPKGEALRDVLGQKPIAVRCSNARWEELRASYPHVVRFREVGSPLAEPIALFEWPGRTRMARLLLPPIGDPTHVVFYRWEREGLRRVQRAREQQVDDHWAPMSRPPVWHLDDVPNSQLGSSLVPLDSSVRDVPAAFVVEDWLLDLRRQNVLARAASTAQGDELVDARAVYFAGGFYALYTTDYEPLVATNVTKSRSVGERTLRPTAVSELRPGDVVVDVVGSNRDAIRDRADERLPPGTRDLARCWHGALARLRQRLGSERALARALADAGCRKKASTIERWLRSPRQIGPQANEDIDAIARASGDEVLKEKLAACKAAIEVVRGEHLRVSHELFDLAIEELERRIVRGETFESTISLGERVRLLLVDAIDETPASVSAGATNSVQEFR